MILPTTATICPQCGRGADLLVAESFIFQGNPSFYICWHCRTVSQVGVGTVPQFTGELNLTREGGLH